jgi:selenocysteine lyase/cysteine desulfurase
MGTPAVPTIYTANGGLDIVLEIGVEQICERTRYLTDDLIRRARDRGWLVRAPLEPERRSSIVMLEFAQPEQVVEELLKRDIIVDKRPGLVRVSPYFYNTIEENEIVINAIADILEARLNFPPESVQ